LEFNPSVHSTQVREDPPTGFQTPKVMLPFNSRLLFYPQGSPPPRDVNQIRLFPRAQVYDSSSSTDAVHYDIIPGHTEHSRRAAPFSLFPSQDTIVQLRGRNETQETQEQQENGDSIPSKPSFSQSTEDQGSIPSPQFSLLLQNSDKGSIATEEIFSIQ
jgi:hypothetical protein